MVDAQQCPSDKVPLEEFPRSSRVIFLVHQVVVSWACLNESNVATFSDPPRLRVVNAVGAAVLPVSDH